MRSNRGGWVFAFALVAIAIAMAHPRAAATTNSKPAIVKWRTTAIVHVTLTPNYHTGFGQVIATFGTQPTPTHGPDAVLNGGSVDFGTVLAGDNYLYKYATHLNVTSNSTSGLSVYGEGAAAFFNTADSTTVPVSQAVYWLNSNNGTDSNTGFSPATPFQLAHGTVTNNGQFTTPTITYTTYPSPISTSPLANTDFYYDYQLKVPATATSGLYYVWIVYTVMAT